MELSIFQQGIIDWVKNGQGHGCCNAVAGSGKSTTLRLAAKALEESGLSPYDIRIIVFGKANAQDLIAKFGKIWESSISTLHSAGWSLIKRHLQIKNPQGLIKANKYKLISQDLGFLGRRNREGDLKRNRYISQDSEFTTLLDLVRLTNETPTPESVRDICSHFEISEIREFYVIASAIAEVLQKGEREAQQAHRFDFCDQIWLPVKWGLKPSQPYRFVLVDECQDLNRSQLELALSLAGEDGRILAVGDPRQAIMGFAGADNRSYQNIVERLQATELPLSICYRCPKSVITLVKTIFPEIPIEASSTAPEGHIESISERDLWDLEKPCHLIEGDMVISRKTAPLVSLCIRLISKGIAATVKGRAIGDQLKSDLDEICKISGFNFSEFNKYLSLYQQAKLERYFGLDDEEKLIEALHDKCEAIATIYKSQPQARGLQDLADYIDSLFSDEHSPITLSTCHRAKGLEGNRIFILKPDDMPMTWRNQQDWQKEQEDNLLYVALTRSKSHLYIVGEPDWLNAPKPKQPAEETVNPTVNADGHEETVKSLQLPILDNPPLLSPSERVRAFLLNPENQLLSDRAIATQLQTSPPTVAKVRKRLKEAGLLSTNGKRISKHGYLINTDGIGAKPRTAKERLAEIVEGLSRDEIAELIEFLTDAATSV